MKILRSNNNNESQFHIMGLTSKEFYATLWCHPFVPQWSPCPLW